MNQPLHPRYLDLAKLRFPISSIASILHRMTGALLFISLPFLVGTLSATLSNRSNFDVAYSLFTHPIVKIILWILLWAFFHHVFAGIRLLILDTHRGLYIKKARASSFFVIFAALIAALIGGGLLLW
ncbi:MAG: succinate dehydrogenase, cytochrome b556 subunit [Haemophilus parainfluenzae]|nr:MAG: succinate dehydrogenase, cytochrome b556 subunit [Haemophilus parainfluenzae]